MKMRYSRLCFGRRGLTTVEYAMLLGAFVVAAVSIWAQLGGGIQGSLADCDDAFDAAVYAGDGDGHGNGRGRGGGHRHGHGWGPGHNRVRSQGGNASGVPLVKLEPPWGSQSVGRDISIACLRNGVMPSVAPRDLIRRRSILLA